jgi:hypothetical protein
MRPVGIAPVTETRNHKKPNTNPKKPAPACIEIIPIVMRHEFTSFEVNDAI